jgi:hypothetical protein
MQLALELQANIILAEYDCIHGGTDITGAPWDQRDTPCLVMSGPKFDPSDLDSSGANKDLTRAQLYIANPHLARSRLEVYGAHSANTIATSDFKDSWFLPLSTKESAKELLPLVASHSMVGFPMIGHGSWGAFAPANIGCNLTDPSVSNLQLAHFLHNYALAFWETPMEASGPLRIDIATRLAIPSKNTLKYIVPYRN